MRPFIHSFDTTLTGIITGWPTWLQPFFVAITTLGSPMITLPIGFFVALAGYHFKNMRLILSGIIVWATLGVGSLIKIAVARERPATEYAANIPLDTMSFPSGHSSGATVAYGLLAYIAWHVLPQPWNYVASVFFALLIIAIGISRIYLGAHFPSDVIAGWLLGIVGLAIIIFFVKPLA